MKRVGVPAEPGRLLQAVASIGYDPEVALCDLMDNCIDAGASLIRLTLSQESHEEEGDTDTISQYVIADDGRGMDEETLLTAFTLGSRREYAPHSLGKFGLGLKSAGLSLGARIIIVTKTEELHAPICGILSRAEVENSGRYEIDMGAAPGELAQLWQHNLPGASKGTLVIVRELTENQPSFARFLDYLRRYCSQIYHLFLGADEKRLRIEINGMELMPIDPLFMTEALANGPLPSPDQWDGRTPHVLVEEQDLALSEGVKATIAATHLIHPPTFEKDGAREEMRDRYLIEPDPFTRRARQGFYVYRNRRIIVLGERFHGVVTPAQAGWAFRGRLMFDESADHILSLDVKKRHCRLPKKARNTLQATIRPYHAKSVQAWKTAGKRYAKWREENKEQQANESITKGPVVDLGYAPGADLKDESAVKARQELQQRVQQSTRDAIQDESITSEDLERMAGEGSAVIPVQSLKANAMWLPYPATRIGRSETLLNRSNTWIAEALAACEEDARLIVILYQLFTVLARAELETRSTPWSDLSPEVVDKVMERFRRKASAIAEDLAEDLATAMAQLSGEPTDE